jgi:hypothetical protein
LPAVLYTSSQTFRQRSFIAYRQVRHLRGLSRSLFWIALTLSLQTLGEEVKSYATQTTQLNGGQALGNGFKHE